VDNILKNIKTEQQTAGVRYLGCKNCAAVQTWDMSQQVPAKCEKCESGAGFVVALSFLEAKEKAGKTIGTQEPEDQPTPAPAPAAKPTRVRKTATETKTSTATETATATVNVTATDAKEARKQAIQKLIETHKLNQIEAVRVGTGTVFTLGFTRWVDGEHGRVPTYCFKELTDDPQSFRGLLDNARKQDGTIRIDVAMLTNIQPEALCDALFNGQLIASMFSKTGPILAVPGASVEIGAKVTKTGGLMFQVGGFAREPSRATVSSKV